jgi:hypothetical protein
MATAKKSESMTQGEWVDPTAEVFEREAEVHKAQAKEAEAEAKAAEKAADS